MAAKHIIARSSLFLGKVYPSVKENAAKIQVKSFELDRRLLMFFAEYEFVFAHDPLKLCKIGDIVLVKQLPQKLTKLITHEVLRVVYPLGDVTDPVTGKKVVGTVYCEDDEHEVELYGGRISSTFVHKEAPPRGWQEDKKDLSHRESFMKWRRGGGDQKYGI